MTTNDSPEPKTTRRWGRPWLWAAIASVLLVIGGLWILFQATIAAIVENSIIDYAARNGIENIRLDVRQITPWRADFYALQVGRPATDDQLLFNSLVLDYSPAGLKAHVIDRVQLNGLDLRLENSTSGWILGGLPSRLMASPETSHRETGPRPHPDWRINRLDIRDSRLDIRDGNRQIAVPFELQMHDADQTGTRYRGELTGQLWHQSFSAPFELNWPQQQVIVEGLTASLDVQQLSQILATQKALPLKGRLTATGQVRLALAPLAIEAAEIQIRLPENITLGDPLNLQVLEPDTPLINVQLAAGRTWTLHAPGFSVTSPPNLRIKDLNGQLRATEGGWHLDGAFNLGFHPPTSDSSAMTATIKACSLPVTYQGQWQEGGPWSFALAGKSTGWEWHQDQKRTAGAGRLYFNPQFSLTASGREDHVKIEATARLAEFKGLFDQTTIRIPAVAVHATGEGPWNQFQGRGEVNADNLAMHAARFNGRLPRLSAESVFTTANGGLQISGQTRLSRGTVRLPDQQMRLEGLRLNIPFTWPYDPSTAGGSFHLAAATWNDLALGAVRGRIRQQADGADFRLTHQSPVLPGAKLQIDGRLTHGTESTRPRVDLDYRFEHAAGPDDIDLGALMTGLAGIHFNGHIEAEGHGIYQGGQMQADLKMKIAGGRLVRPEQKSGLVGLRGRVTFPNLLAMRSAPKQQVFFERAYIGDIAATDGQLDFQIEPESIFFLEQSRFKWVHGAVYLPATRIVPGKNDYDVTLWCDRLKLAPLLEQLGAARAEGGGTVSGRIPIHIRQGQFLIDNGFLYSSPGEGGTIRLHGTDMLTAGIPPGTPQYNQLELARQALREYDYDWVKLGLETAPQEDLLRLKLQLNGRPARPLPFIYDSRTGGFVPSGPGSPGSHFEEIKLDVNFSLPLNRLLEYKDLLKLFS